MSSATVDSSPGDTLGELLRLRRDLELREYVLEFATTHFMVLDTRQSGSPIVYVNRALCRDHGYEPEELLGKSVPGTIIDPELNFVQLEELAEVFRTGRQLRTELQARRKDGSTFWAGIYVIAVKDRDGRVSHLVSVGTDITARREEERTKRKLQEQLYNEMRERERIAIELRLAQKLEAVGRLAAGVAHEINTPIQYIGDSVHFLSSAMADYEKLLTAYRRAIQRLAQGEKTQAVLEDLAEKESRADIDFLAAEIPKAFERTLDGVDRVASIVRAMKEFAHPDANEQRPADINRALETTLTVARTEYKYSASVEMHFQSLPEVTCNIGELNQVFLNLIVNATHAIQESGKDVASGRITVSTAAAGDCVVISIADNGCGIPEENLDKVFDPFFTTKEVGKGTGQGLAIARSIVVEKHGGSIDLHSTVGVGTRIIIELPVAGRAASERAA
jgi:PAS domain S-box-containing protein